VGGFDGGAELDRRARVRGAAVDEQRLDGVEPPRPDAERALAGAFAEGTACKQIFRNRLGYKHCE
jgi:hypothetical protein